METRPLSSLAGLSVYYFERRFPNFIADNMNWFLNSMSDLKLFCVKAYQNQNFTVT